MPDIRRDISAGIAASFRFLHFLIYHPGCNTAIDRSKSPGLATKVTLYRGNYTSWVCLFQNFLNHEGNEFYIRLIILHEYFYHILSMALSFRENLLDLLNYDVVYFIVLFLPASLHFNRDTACNSENSSGPLSLFS